PGLSGWSPAATAVVTNSRSPQTTGAEWPRPGTGTFHFTPRDVSTSHSTGVGRPSDTPPAAGPRNWGQLTPFGSSAQAGRQGASQRTEGTSRSSQRSPIPRFSRSGA